MIRLCITQREADDANGQEAACAEQESLWAIDIRLDPTFATEGRPRKLFEIENGVKSAPPTHSGYDISPDDGRFLMVQRSDARDENAPIVVVQRWSEELTARVPTDR